MLRMKRAKQGKGSARKKTQLGNETPSKRTIRKGKIGTSESTENFADGSSRPRSTLKIWHRSEYSVDANDSKKLHAEDTELKTIWAGPLGTTAMVEAERKQSQASGHSDDGNASKK